MEALEIADKVLGTEYFLSKISLYARYLSRIYLQNFKIFDPFLCLNPTNYLLKKNNLGEAFKMQSQFAAPVRLSVGLSQYYLGIMHLILHSVENTHKAF